MEVSRARTGKLRRADRCHLRRHLPQAASQRAIVRALGRAFPPPDSTASVVVASRVMDAKKKFEGKHIVVLDRNDWEFVERKKAKEAVAIVALTDDGEIILTEQYRAPVDARVIDLPAGLIEQYEAEETAWRELEEETGFTCDEVVLLASSPTSPGITSEIVHLYRAKGVRRVGKGGGVGGEDIDVHLVRLTDMPTWLESQKILGDAKIWAGLYLSLQST